MPLTDLRRNYTLGSLTESDLTNNPLQLFDSWLEHTIKSELPDPNAMTLATVSSDGVVSQRIVLLKGRPDDNFVFYTNYNSDKAQDIASNNRVSLHFPWYMLERQIMVLGKAYKLTDEQNDEYFAMRPKASRIGAIVSAQSQPLASRDEMVSAYLTLTEKYQTEDVKRPAHWGGYYVVPDVIEFWQGGEHRLHDRFKYTRLDGTTSWTVQRLNP